MIQFILGSIAAVFLSELNKNSNKMAKGGKIDINYKNPVEYLNSIGINVRKDELNYTTSKNDINFYVGYKDKKAIVVAFIEDEDNYMIDKEDAREMVNSAKIKGIDTIELHTNYGIELRKKEKPTSIGFDKIYKLSVGDFQ